MGGSRTPKAVTLDCFQDSCRLPIGLPFQMLNFRIPTLMIRYQQGSAGDWIRTSNQRGLSSSGMPVPVTPAKAVLKGFEPSISCLTGKRVRPNYTTRPRSGGRDSNPLDRGHNPTVYRITYLLRMVAYISGEVPSSPTMHNNQSHYSATDSANWPSQPQHLERLHSQVTAYWSTV